MFLIPCLMYLQEGAIGIMAYIGIIIYAVQLVAIISVIFKFGSLVKLLAEFKRDYEGVEEMDELEDL